MTETMFAIFMVSCSHMLGVCRETTEVVDAFASSQACEQQLYRSLDKASARFEDTFPIAIGKCVEVPRASALQETSFKWFFHRDGSLSVQATQPTEVQNAANTETQLSALDEG